MWDDGVSFKVISLSALHKNLGNGDHISEVGMCVPL